MGKKVQKARKKASKTRRKLRFRNCIFCERRVMLPKQLCALCANRARALKGPKAGVMGKDLIGIITQGRADRRLSMVEKFSQTHSKKFDKL
jgi:hypothetical protein